MLTSRLLAERALDGLADLVDRKEVALDVAEVIKHVANELRQIDVGGNVLLSHFSTHHASEAVG